MDATHDILIQALDRLADAPFPLVRDWWAGFGLRARGRDQLHRKVTDALKQMTPEVQDREGRTVAILGTLLIDLPQTGEGVTLGRLEDGGIVDSITETGDIRDQWDIDLGWRTSSAIPDRPYKVVVQDGLISRLGTIEVGIDGDAFYTEVDLDRVWILEGTLESDDDLPNVVMQLEMRNGLADCEWYAVLVRNSIEWERVPGLLAWRNGKAVTDTGDIHARMSWGSVTGRARHVGEERDLGQLSREEFDDFCRLHIKPGEELDDAVQHIRSCKALDFEGGVRLTLEASDGPLAAHHILEQMGFCRPFSEALLGTCNATLGELVRNDAISSRVTAGQSGTYAQGTLKSHTMTSYEIKDEQGDEPMSEEHPPTPAAPAEIDLDALNDDLELLSDVDEGEAGVEPGEDLPAPEARPCEPDPVEKHIGELEGVCAWLRALSLSLRASTQADSDDSGDVVIDILTGEEVDLARAMLLLAEARTLTKQLDGAHLELAAFEKANKDLEADLDEANHELEAAREDIEGMAEEIKSLQGEVDRLGQDLADCSTPSDAGALPPGLEGDIARLGKGVSARLVTGLDLWVEVAHARQTAEAFIASSASHAYGDMEAMADASAWIEALKKRL